MKNSSRHFSQVQKQVIFDRDGFLCRLCGRLGQDVDHAFRLSTCLPFIEETWNGNVLCRQCHTEVTLPDTAAKWLKSLRVIDLAFMRLQQEREPREWVVHEAHFRSRIALFRSRYPEESAYYIPDSYLSTG